MADNVILGFDETPFIFEVHMRHYYEKSAVYFSMYGETYICNHPVYDKCTLFRIKNRGVSVIQQRFDPETKTTFWTDIDPWLTDELYLNISFKKFFDEHADTEINGIFPTFTIRQIMWALKMKPLPRELWETSFDRKDI